jgi:ADP-ribose diphosphatase
VDRPLPIVHATREVDARGRLHLEEIELEFANGARRRFERLRGSGRGAVVIVPMLDRDTVLLVREYAAGFHRYELGLPKGRIEPGETPEQAANRELKEEIGFGARRLSLIARLSLAPAYMNHLSHVVLAESLYEEKLPGDEPEELEVVPWSLSRLNELIEREDCSEGRSLAALFIARERIARR